LIDQIGGWRWLTSAFSITFLLEAAVFWILRNIGYLERLIRVLSTQFPPRSNKLSIWLYVRNTYFCWKWRIWRI